MTRLKLTEGWTTVLLLAFLSMILTSSVDASTWVVGTGVLLPGALWGLALSLVLARSRLRGILCLPLFGLGAVAATFWLQTPLLVPEDVFQIGRPLVLAVSGRLQQWGALLSHVTHWFQAALGSQVSNDNLVYLIFLGWLVFAASAWLGFAALRHRRGWLALVPSAVVMVSNVLNTTNNQQLLFLVWLLGALLLVSRVHFSSLERYWLGRDIGTPTVLVWSYLQRTAAVVVALILLTTFLPSLSPGYTAAQMGVGADTAWNNWSTFWDRLFGGVRGTSSGGDLTGFSLVVDPGGPLVQTSTPVLKITTSSELGPFWRGAVLNYFDGSRWRVRGPDWLTLEQPLPHGQPVVGEILPGQQQLTATVTVLQGGPRNVIFSPLQPLVADQDVLGRRYSPPSDGGLTGDSWDILATVGTAASYRVTGLISQAPVTALEGASGSLPQAVQQVDLQLPPGWSDSPEGAPIARLAREITAGSNNNYDAATAIQNFLRQHYTYSLKVAAPPPGNNALDWFLFNSHRGYCQMYASSMGAMLRSIGIPARLVNGYEAGARGAKRGGAVVYSVRESDAHTIVEAYLPTYGWIPFEPTAGSALFARPLRTAGQSSIGEHGGQRIGGTRLGSLANSSRYRESATGPVRLGTPQPQPATLPWQIPALALLAAATALLVGSLVFLSARRPQAVWRRLGWSALWAGSALKPADTPAEVAARLRMLFPRWVGRDPAALLILVELEARRRYGPVPLGSPQEREFARAWHALRQRSWALALDLIARAWRRSGPRATLGVWRERALSLRSAWAPQLP